MCLLVLRTFLRCFLPIRWSCHWVGPLSHIEHSGQYTDVPSVRCSAGKLGVVSSSLLTLLEESPSSLSPSSTFPADSPPPAANALSNSFLSSSLPIFVAKVRFTFASAALICSLAWQAARLSAERGVAGGASMSGNGTRSEPFASWMWTAH